MPLQPAEGAATRTSGLLALLMGGYYECIRDSQLEDNGDVGTGSTATLEKELERRS